MTSRLSSLLVRDGVVTVSRMEKAFQRQVLHSGGLDTILLEMGELSEQRLSQYLSLATGLPPALPRELSNLDVSLAEQCALQVAKLFKVVPFGIEGDALRFATCEPVDLSALEDLASELGVAIQPFVTPEFRYQLAHHRLYGVEIDPRFERIASKVTDEAPINPVGKPKTIVVASELSEKAVESRRSAADRVTTPVTREDKAPIESAVPSGQPASSDDTEDGGYADMSVEDGPDTVVEDVPDIGAIPVETIGPSDTQRVPIAFSDARASETLTGEIDSSSADKHAPRLAVATRLEDFGIQPIPFNRIPREFEQAEHRDTIFEILLRALRARTDYAAVLTVQGGAAIGRIAIDGEVVDQHEIAKVLIPFDGASNFKQAAESGAPYIGPIATGDSSVDAMIRRLGGVMPPAAVLLPLSIKGRVVALLVGHRGSDNLKINEISELLPIAGWAADALLRVIKQGKEGKKKRSEQPVAKVEAAPDPMEEESTQRLVSDDLPPRAPAPVASGFEALMLQVQGGDDQAAENAIVQALAKTDELLPWLMENFPGKLLIHRNEVSGTGGRAAQYGRVLDLVVRLADGAEALLIEKMDHDHDDVRFYAVVCASEIHGEGLARSFAGCLFDNDYGVRESAVAGLSGYPYRLLEEALGIPRRALRGDDPERCAAAARALGDLGDTASVSLLLELVHRGGEPAAAGARALTTLTRHNFGTSAKKWKQWWDKHSQLSHIEWLIAALSGKEAELCRAAADDLRTITGEEFPFDENAPKRERDQVRKQWQSWWQSTGQQRYAKTTDVERHRQTDILPSRR